MAKKKRRDRDQSQARAVEIVVPDAQEPAEGVQAPSDISPCLLPEPQPATLAPDPALVTGRVSYKAANLSSRPREALGPAGPDAGMMIDVDYAATEQRIAAAAVIDFGYPPDARGLRALLLGDTAREQTADEARAELEANGVDVAGFLEALELTRKNGYRARGDAKAKELAVEIEAALDESLGVRANDGDPCVPDGACIMDGHCFAHSTEDPEDARDDAKMASFSEAAYLARGEQLRVPDGAVPAPPLALTGGEVWRPPSANEINLRAGGSAIFVARARVEHLNDVDGAQYFDEVEPPGEDDDLDTLRNLAGVLASSQDARQLAAALWGMDVEPIVTLLCGLVEGIEAGRITIRRAGAPDDMFKRTSKDMSWRESVEQRLQELRGKLSTSERMLESAERRVAHLEKTTENAMKIGLHMREDRLSRVAALENLGERIVRWAKATKVPTPLTDESGAEYSKELEASRESVGAWERKK